jgi:ATP-dependent Lon protease
MSESFNEYNLRSKNRKNGDKRTRYDYEDNMVNFTKDGYIDDGFVVDEEWCPGNPSPYIEDYFELDSEGIQSDSVSRIVEGQGMGSSIYKTPMERAFHGTGGCTLRKYTDCDESEDSWKLGLSDGTINNIEPELKRIRRMIDDEIPSIPKIYEANITEMDKMKCTKLYDQLQNLEPCTTEYDSKVSEINNILRKGNKYTKEELKQMEAEAKKLKSLAIPHDDLEDRILKLDADDHIKSIIYGQYLEMMGHEIGSQTYNSIREEIEWSVKLPHNKSHETDDLSNLSRSELNRHYQHFLELMDEELYGMKAIKLKMLHIINDRRKSGDECGRNIAVVGPPGTGKTAIGKAMAKVLGLPFEKISMGGMDDASIFKGSDRVWNSSSPSIVLQILARIKSSSGVIMFDELDKLGETPKGKEVQYALLHISDYVHNKEFRDNYLNKYPHDFSKLLFVFCANKIETLDSALLNRLDIIYTKEYTEEEKRIITTKYVLPRALTKIGMKSNQVKFNDKAMSHLVASTRNDPGVRTIERIVKEVVGKINMYDSVILDDGTTGDLDLGYKIPQFKLPLTINIKLFNDLTADMIE